MIVGLAGEEVEDRKKVVFYYFCNFRFDEGDGGCGCEYMYNWF